MGTVLVTGGAGFIGSHVCKALAASGSRLVVYDNLTRGNRSAVQWGDLVVGDLRDKVLLRKTIEAHGVDSVIHMAALAYVRESMQFPDLYWHNNVVGTKTLLDVMAEAGVKHMVFSSSCASYGVPQEVPIPVSCGQNPINPYGRTKLACEWMIRDFAQQHGWDCAILRYFNVAGSDPDLKVGEVHEPETHIVPLLLLHAMETSRDPLRLFGRCHPTPDGTCVRDYIHVVDLAAVHAKALEHIAARRTSVTFNVALGRGTSIQELLTVCEEVTGRRVPHRWEGPEPGDPPCLIADPGGVWETFGLSPRFPEMTTMVEHAWQWILRGRPAWIKLRHGGMDAARVRSRDCPSSAQRGEVMMRRGIQVSASGRLCLFGEHSDWAARHGVHPGLCISVGTDQRLQATVQVSDCFSVETVLSDGTVQPSGRTRQMACPWEARALRAAAEDRSEFFRYCAGVAHEILTKLGVGGGIEIRVTDVDLPLQKGLSSSAAVCVLVAQAFDQAWDLRLSREDLMDLAYNGERLTGSQCGRLDQSCIYGKTPVLLTFGRGETMKVDLIDCSGSVYLFFVDLGAAKDTVRILTDLQARYPSSEDLQRALGPENQRIALLAREALKVGDARTLGYLMNQAQAVFDDLVAPSCPAELRSPLLHQVLAYQAISKHVYGGKGVGSQGDGAAQFVARSERDRNAAMRLVEQAFPSMRCFPLTIEGDTRAHADKGEPLSRREAGLRRSPQQRVRAGHAGLSQ